MGTGRCPATVRTITRSPVAAGAICPSRSSVGPLEVAYSSMVLVRSAGNTGVPYTASQYFPPRALVTPGAMPPHASELIRPSLYTPKMETLCRAGWKPAAYWTDICALPQQAVADTARNVHMTGRMARIGAGQCHCSGGSVQRRCVIHQRFVLPASRGAYRRASRARHCPLASTGLVASSTPTSASEKNIGGSQTGVPPHAVMQTKPRARFAQSSSVAHFCRHDVASAMQPPSFELTWRYGRHASPALQSLCSVHEMPSAPDVVLPHPAATSEPIVPATASAQSVAMIRIGSSQSL